MKRAMLYKGMTSGEDLGLWDTKEHDCDDMVTWAMAFPQRLKL